MNPAVFKSVNHAACIAVVGAMLLGGCATPRPVERADALVKLPDAFGVDDGATAPGVCENLGLPELDGLYSRVDRENYQLRGALAQLRRADALAAQSRSRLLPRVDAQVSATRGNAFGAGIGVPGLDQVRNLDQGTVPVSYEADLWRRAGDDYDAALLDAYAEAENVQALRIALAAGLAQNWSSLVSQRGLADLIDEQREISARFLELTRLRFGQGLGAARDIGQQKQQLQSLDGQFALAESRAAVLRGELAGLLSQTVGDSALPDRRQLPAPPLLPEAGLPADLVTARPDVRAGRARLMAADLRLASALDARLPSLSLSGSLISVEDTLANLFRDVLWQIGANISLPVFDGGLRAAQVDGADAGAEAALYSYAETLLAALNEVITTMTVSNRTDDYVASLNQQIDEARRVLDLTRDAYRLGQGDYLNVLVSLQSLQSLQRTRIDARQQQFSDRIQLCRALGQTVGRPVSTSVARIAGEES